MHTNLSPQPGGPARHRLNGEKPPHNSTNSSGTRIDTAQVSKPYTMSRRNLYIALAISAAVALSAYLLSQRSSIRPDREVCDATYTPLSMSADTSVLSTPLVIPTRLITEKINAALKKDLLRDTNFNNISERTGRRDQVKMLVERSGDIEIQWKDNHATCSVPLGIIVERRLLNIKKITKDDGLAAKLNFALRLSFDVDLAVGEDWRLDTRTQFKQMEWIEEPKAILGIFDLKKGIEKRLLAEMPNVQAKIDQQIHDLVRLEHPMNRIWNKLQKPIAFNKAHKVAWLQFTPLQVELGKITTENGDLLVQTRVRALTRTLIGTNPQYEVDSTLPPLIIRKSLPDTAQVHLLAEIPFDDLNDLLRSQFVGNTFEVKGKKLHIRKAEVSGCGSDMVLALTVKGDMNGMVYLRGQPYFDPLSQRLSLQNFDFELNTNQMLLTYADWLLHSTFKHYAQERLSLPLSERVQQIPQRIMTGIERGKDGHKLDFGIESWHFQPHSVQVHGQMLVANVTADARVRIELEKL